MMETSQNGISRLESPNYGKATTTTLKKLAAVYDVGLVVRFVPFSKMADWVSANPYVERGLSPESVNVKDFEEEEQSGALEEEPQGDSLELLELIQPPNGCGQDPTESILGAQILHLAVENTSGKSGRDLSRRRPPRRTRENARRKLSASKPAA
jgi:hypothetical protein